VFKGRHLPKNWRFWLGVVVLTTLVVWLTYTSRDLLTVGLYPATWHTFLRCACRCTCMMCGLRVLDYRLWIDEVVS